MWILIGLALAVGLFVALLVLRATRQRRSEFVQRMRAIDEPSLGRPSPRPTAASFQGKVPKGWTKR